MDMNIDKIIEESIKKSLQREMLFEFRCQGRQDWPNSRENSISFLNYYRKFFSEFQKLEKIIANNKGDLSEFVKEVTTPITDANQCLPKLSGGWKIGNLQERFNSILHLLYGAKYTMLLNLCLFIKENEDRFRRINIVAYPDGENGASCLDITLALGNKNTIIGSYHMPIKVDDLKVMAMECSEHLKDANDAPNSIQKDIKKTGDAIENRLYPNNNKMDKMKEEEAKEKIKKGYIILAFNDKNKPCVYRSKKGNKEAFTAIPNAYTDSKNSPLFKDKKGNPVWFRKYKIDGDMVTFTDCVNGNFEGYLDQSGQTEMEDIEMIKEHAKKIVKALLLKESRKQKRHR